MGLAPILDGPTAGLGQALKLAMRVDRDRLVRPLERRGVRHMVGIETDVAMLALEACPFAPVCSHPHLPRAISICAVDPCVDPFGEADDRAGADDVVETEPRGY